MIERVCKMVPTYRPYRGREVLGVRGEEIEVGRETEGGGEERWEVRRERDRVIAKKGLA